LLAAYVLIPKTTNPGQFYLLATFKDSLPTFGFEKINIDLENGGAGSSTIIGKFIPWGPHNGKAYGWVEDTNLATDNFLI